MGASAVAPKLGARPSRLLELVLLLVLLLDPLLVLVLTSAGRGEQVQVLLEVACDEGVGGRGHQRRFSLLQRKLLLHGLLLARVDVVARGSRVLFAVWVVVSLLLHLCCLRQCCMCVCCYVWGRLLFFGGFSSLFSRSMQLAQWPTIGEM